MDNTDPWSNLLNTAVNAGTGALNNLVGGHGNVAPTATQPAAAAAPAPAASWTKYLPYAIGGFLLLVVVGIIFRRK